MSGKRASGERRVGESPAKVVATDVPLALGALPPQAEDMYSLRIPDFGDAFTQMSSRGIVLLMEGGGDLLRSLINGLSANEYHGMVYIVVADISVCSDWAYSESITMTGSLDSHNVRRTFQSEANGAVQRVLFRVPAGFTGTKLIVPIYMNFSECRIHSLSGHVFVTLECDSALATEQYDSGVTGTYPRAIRWTTYVDTKGILSSTSVPAEEAPEATDTERRNTMLDFFTTGQLCAQQSVSGCSIVAAVPPDQLRSVFESGPSRQAQGERRSERTVSIAFAPVKKQPSLLCMSVGNARYTGASSCCQIWASRANSLSDADAGVLNERVTGFFSYMRSADESDVGAPLPSDAHVRGFSAAVFMQPVRSMLTGVPAAQTYVGLHWPDDCGPDGAPTQSMPGTYNQETDTHVAANILVRVTCMLNGPVAAGSKDARGEVSITLLMAQCVTSATL
jgi:hypothetical protein